VRAANGAVRKLALAICDERAFDRLPILADMLKDAGCGDADPLVHLRGPGPHHLGCYALDAVLHEVGWNTPLKLREPAAGKDDLPPWFQATVEPLDDDG
jgi:hypothetical protein